MFSDDTSLAIALAAGGLSINRRVDLLLRFSLCAMLRRILLDSFLSEILDFGSLFEVLAEPA